VEPCVGRDGVALEHSTSIHERALTQVAESGLGEAGIAEAVHERTGYAIAIEDGTGNLRAWAGPANPTPYPRTTPRPRGMLPTGAGGGPHGSGRGPGIYLVAR